MTFILHIYASGRFIWRKELDECFSYVHKDFFTSLEAAMDAAILEMKRFGEKCKHLEYLWRSWLTSIWIALPTLLADEEERATTRYINITTIATFFSSVAATTLQFTVGQSSSGSSDSLRGVVNLFWFLSLIFSVSAGVNSLLGMTWRKSSVYVTRHSCGLKNTNPLFRYYARTPPKLILLWLDKAPVIFLIVAAVTFIIGLNLFVYQSVQVSLQIYCFRDLLEALFSPSMWH